MPCIESSARHKASVFPHIDTMQIYMHPCCGKTTGRENALLGLWRQGGPEVTPPPNVKRRVEKILRKCYRFRCVEISPQTMRTINARGLFSVEGPGQKTAG